MASSTFILVGQSDPTVMQRRCKFQGHQRPARRLFGRFLVNRLSALCIEKIALLDPRGAAQGCLLDIKISNIQQRSTLLEVHLILVCTNVVVR